MQTSAPTNNLALLLKLYVNNPPSLSKRIFSGPALPFLKAPSPRDRYSAWVNTTEVRSAARRCKFY